MAYYLYRFGSSVLLPTGASNDGFVAEVATDAAAVAGGVHWALGDEVAEQRTHTIQHTGIYSSSVESNVNALFGLVGRRDWLYRYEDSSGDLHRKKARLLTCDWRRDVKQRSHAQITSTFQAAGNWEDDSQSSASRSTTGTLNLTTAGLAYVWNATAEFTASSTTTHTFRLQESGTGIDWQWSGSITSGQTVIIDAGAYAVTNNGADAYSGLTVNSGHTARRWLILPPNATTEFTFTLSAGAGTFYVKWYDQWL